MDASRSGSPWRLRPGHARARSRCSAARSAPTCSSARPRWRAARSTGRRSARARGLGIPLSERRTDAAARALLRDLRQGVSLDPRLVTLLREALAPLAARPLPESLADVAGWLGASAARRGATLRGLLRASDPLVRARPRRRERAPVPFPRFASRPERGG